MNPAIHIAIMAANQAEEGIAARLRKAEAINASSAIEFTPADAAEQKLLDEAIGLGLVVRRSDGRIFLNERAVSERNEGIGYGLLLGLLALGSAAASIAALIAFAGR